MLAVFNLLPVPPLDGSKMLGALLPRPLQGVLWSLERYGFLIVVLVITVFREPVFRLINGVTFALMRVILGTA